MRGFFTCLALVMIALATAQAEVATQQGVAKRGEGFVATGRKAIPKRCFQLAEQRGWVYPTNYINRIKAARRLHQTGQC